VTTADTSTSDFGLLKQIAARDPRALVSAEFALRAALETHSQAPVASPANGLWTLRQLGALFPTARGPRSPSSMRARVKRGDFGAPGTDAGPRLQDGEWVIPDVAVQRYLVGGHPVVVAPSPEGKRSTRPAEGRSQMHTGRRPPLTRETLLQRVERRKARAG
jgi:hypothetical protein